MIAENVMESIQDSNQYLTNFVKRPKVADSFGDFIAPPFQVKLENGNYVVYNDDIFRVWENQMAGRQEAREIQWNVSHASYACEEYGLCKFVSDKAVAQNIAPIRLEQEAADRVQWYQRHARDYRIWAIAGNTAIVTQTLNIGGAWSTAAGTPITDILNAMATVETSIGVLPNRVLIPRQVALNMIRCTEWQTYFLTAGNFAYAPGAPFSVTGGLAKLGLEVLECGTKGLSTHKCTASDPHTEAMWNDSVLLFYCEPNPSTDCMSFMYSPYVKRDIITRTRMPRRRGIFIDIYEDIEELLAEANAAYLFTNCI